MTILVKSPNVSTATGLQKFRFDPVLKGDNGGVKFLFDFASPVGWPAQNAPVNGSVIKNVATTPDVMTLGDGAMNIVSGQTVAFAGGGVDFNGLTNDPVEVVGPASSLSSIAAAANDYFLMCCYMRLPSSADWIADVGILPFFCATTASGGYVSEADIVTVAFQAGPGLAARRQTNGSAHVALNMTSLANFFSQVCQIAVWRNAAGYSMRVRSALGQQTVSAVEGANNAGNFSAQRPRWGVPASFNALSSAASHRAAHKTRLYRGWIEDLTASGRDPVTVLDADWTRVQARKTASDDTIFV